MSLGFYTGPGEESYRAVIPLSSVEYSTSNIPGECTPAPIANVAIESLVNSFLDELGIELPSNSLEYAFLRHQLECGVNVASQFFIEYVNHEQLLNNPLHVAGNLYEVDTKRPNITLFRKIEKSQKKYEDVGNKVVGAYALVEVASKLQNEQHKAEADKIVTKVIDELVLSNPAEALNLMLLARGIGVNGFSNEYVHQVINKHKEVFDVYYSDLLGFLNCVDFANTISITDFITMYRVSGNSPLILYPDLLRFFIDTLIDQKVLKLTEEGAVTKGKNFSKPTSLAQLEKDRLLRSAAHPAKNLLPNLTTLKNVGDLYSSSKPELTVVKNDGKKVLFLSEILFGNSALDVEQLQRVITYLQALKQEDKPEIIVLSELVEGDRKTHKVKERVGVLEAMRIMTNQFAAAKSLLDELRNACPSAELIYVLSQTDLEIIDEYTLIVMKMLKELAKGSSSGSVADEFIAYYAANQLRTSEGWDTHLDFQTNIAYPYCLNIGRSLLSAKEISELTNGRYEIEEYLILYEVVKYVRGEIDHINADYLGLVSVDIISALINRTPYKNFTFTKGVRLGDKVISTSFSANSSSADSGRIRGLLVAGASNSEQNYVLLGSSSPLVVGVGCESVVISSSTFLNGGLATPVGEGNRRARKTRYGATPGTVSHRLGNDGRHYITLCTEDFLRIAAETKDEPRCCTGGFSDLHIGSISSNPALLVSAMDIVKARIASHKFLLGFLGDQVNGLNFPNSVFENFSTKLIRLEDQQAVVIYFLGIFMNSLGPNISNIEKCLLLSGNHEWNSGHKHFGVNYTLALSEFLKKYISPDKLVDAQALVTLDGSFVRTHAAVVNKFGGSSIFANHIIADRKARGTIPGLAVSKIANLVKTGLLKPGDFSIHGHYHNFQLYGSGGAFGVIFPSTCSQTTSFELGLGLGSNPGVCFIHTGGGELPMIEYVPFATLARHRVTGIEKLTDQYLADTYGLYTPRDFDPLRHGMYGPGPKSALMRRLFDITDEVIFRGTSFLN